MFLGDAMVLDEPLLGPAPKSLRAVDVHFSGREPFLMIHIQAPVSAEHQAVAAFELVRVNHAAPADLLYRQTQQGFSGHVT